MRSIHPGFPIKPFVLLRYHLTAAGTSLGYRLLAVVKDDSSVLSHRTDLPCGWGNQHEFVAFIRGLNSRFKAGLFHCGCLLYRNNINTECEIRCPLFLYELTVPGRDIMSVVK